MRGARARAGRGEGAREGLATDPFLAVDLPNARPRARPFAGTYLDFVKATTLSAKLNAPSLVPYFLYVYLPDQEFGEEDDLTRWLKRMGTRVVPWRLSILVHYLSRRRSDAPGLDFSGRPRPDIMKSGQGRES